MGEKKKPKRQPEIKPLRVDGVTLRAICDLEDVTYDLETKDLRQAIFLAPTIWVDEDDERQIFGAIKALDIALTAAEVGKVYEIPVLDLMRDEGRALAKCHEWVAGKYHLLSGPFALLTRAGSPGGDRRTLLIGVDNDDDGNGFKFTAAQAFRTPNGCIGWASSLSAIVSRKEDDASYRTFGGTETSNAGTYLDVLFHALA